ncbi:hypothetical protein PIB30_072929 [Stylosanthes scabra]|uniref:Uncharacterized protein n=1 Tax=Stylosanthes scabra TaxID=79078 RepID=A0ABU6WQ01_9FABA|nr:hypothetical protein [Stylosanthes scabra]
MGNRPPRALPESPRPSKVSDCSNRVRNPMDYNIRQWDAIHGQKVQRIPRIISNPPTVLIHGAPTSKWSGRSHEQSDPEQVKEETRHDERMLGGRAWKRTLGL